jgi:HAD superfamily hydrolase (TIGR01509 family)
LLRENGRDLTYEQFRPTFGRRNEDVLVHDLGFDVGPDTIARLAEPKEHIFLDCLARTGLRFQPGADELVHHSEGLGFTQAIASSAPRRNLDFITARLPNADCFECVVSAEEVRHGKPAPDIFNATLECLRRGAGGTVVFEDAPAGIEAAKAAGCRAIAITAAFSPEQLAAADLVVTSFAEVLWPGNRWLEFLAGGE